MIHVAKSTCFTWSYLRCDRAKCFNVQPSPVTPVWLPPGNVSSHLHRTQHSWLSHWKERDFYHSSLWHLNEFIRIWDENIIIWYRVKPNRKILYVEKYIWVSCSLKQSALNAFQIERNKRKFCVILKGKFTLKLIFDMF